MTDDKLKPCPFCGCRAVPTRTLAGVEWWSVECMTCTAKVDDPNSKQDAAKVWNTRATDIQVSKHSELAEESLALELLGRLTDKIEAGVDAIFLPREKAIACVSEFIAEQREGFLIDLATVMHKHLENWPEGEFKKVSTAMALLDKTLHSALNPSKHDYWGAGEPDCPKEIKAGNGELHTLRCRVCGMDNPSDNRCAALRQAPEAQVSKLVSALEHIAEYWNRDQNETAMADALWHIIETAETALDGMGSEQ